MRGRDLLASEQRDSDTIMGELERLGALADMIAERAYWSSGERCNIDMRGEIDRDQILATSGGHPGLRGAGRPGEPDTRDGVPLGREQRMADWVRARPDIDIEQEPLSFGKILRGLVLGDWRGADAERRTMLGGIDPSGGYLLPVTLMSEIIDLTRNQVRYMCRNGCRIRRRPGARKANRSTSRTPKLGRSSLPRRTLRR